MPLPVCGGPVLCPLNFSGSSALLHMGWHLLPTLIPSYPVVFLPLLLFSWAFTRAERSPCGQHTILNRRSHLSLLTTWLGGSLLCAPVCEPALSLSGAVAATILPSWGRVPLHHSEPEGVERHAEARLEGPTCEVILLPLLSGHPLPPDSCISHLPTSSSLRCPAVSRFPSPPSLHVGNKQSTLVSANQQGLLSLLGSFVELGEHRFLCWPELASAGGQVPARTWSPHCPGQPPRHMVLLHFWGAANFHQRSPRPHSACLLLGRPERIRKQKRLVAASSGNLYKS